ncbi:MAG: hypothetical protein CL902_04035 [Dehalococcoidia bacterium]|nr:hypothetical protein [Dehalococcoidia bacterium]|tara:strand:- start:866 stop:1522 length:657 start_codon:yes stop_codon:yes gene_type:complete
MKRILIVIAGLILALAVACSAEPTLVPKVPTPTTVPPVETATPRPVAEWSLEDTTVRGDTVIVAIFFHSTPSIDVTVGGNPPTRKAETLPTISYFFEDLDPGEHKVEIQDVMGNMESTSVVVDEQVADNGSEPEWLAEWLTNLQALEVDNPPMSITRYENQGEVVYYVVNQCCDQYSDLLDAEGNLIGHPDGGVTGRGDGVTVFDPTGLKGEEVWLGR